MTKKAEMSIECIVKCSPSNLPHSIPVLLRLLEKNGVSWETSVHIHSDLGNVSEDERSRLLKFLPESCKGNRSKLRLTLLWLPRILLGGLEFQHGSKSCLGEINLLKFLSEKLDFMKSDLVSEVKLDEIQASTGEAAVMCQIIQQWTSLQMFLSGNQFGLADLFLYSHLVQIPLNKIKDASVQKWLSICSSFVKGSTMSEIEDGPAKKQTRLFEFFTQNGISFHNIEHPEVFTVETMMPHLRDVKKGSAIAKNLFLKDKKGNLYLLAALHDKNVNLAQISKAIKVPGGGLRFASEEILYEKLGVKQGCVTAYALLNDVDKSVQFLLDEDFAQHEFVYFHPLVNSASTGISYLDFKKFVSLTGHVVINVRI